MPTYENFRGFTIQFLFTKLHAQKTHRKYTSTLSDN